MRKILDSSKSKKFAGSTFDPNDFHDDEKMWRAYNIPAIVPGFQLLTSSLAAVDSDELIQVNAGSAYFTKALVPVGSEVTFEAKPQKGGISKEKGWIKLTAETYGTDVICDDENSASAKRLEVGERMYFWEGGMPTLTIKVNDNDLSHFQEITGLTKEAIPALYSISLSSASIANRVNYPTTPAWIELNRGLNDSDKLKARIPAYDSLQFFLPGGMRDYNSGGVLSLRSAINRQGKIFTVDTVCYDGNEQFSGVRATLRQKSIRAIVKGIKRTLESIEQSGNPGTLENTIERMRLNSGNSD
jgi:hypothetical protein